VEILMQEYHVEMISFLTMNQNLLQFMRIIKQIKTYLKDKAETQKKTKEEKSFLIFA
jgi:hypothetical protein